ncbi:MULTISPECIES: helix-turn-helix domain-containing protein [Persicobacter]|uniref:HTH cro/C1-type domain-containing protein n=1 Tax=Persicobacter diffluens TaxID=981 RepID=A0AAN5AK78_9BACT|nr:helix-turn-helix domain-containing protein [Persicobacter sp. CCB-QB2]GJM59623.1 hypothetical protein PEDI_01750 [Persicobacter diffluens]
MEALKYKIIKDREQYEDYCEQLEALLALENPELEDEIELLTFLIEKYDEEHSSFNELSPIALLRELMASHSLNQSQLGEIMGVQKSTVSKVLNLQKGLSKESIRRLADHFKLRQEAFNRPYELLNQEVLKSS